MGEEEEEDLAEENAAENINEDKLIGQRVTIRPREGGFDYNHANKKVRKGTVLRKNHHYFGAKYEKGRRIDMSRKQLDGLLNNIEMKIVDLVLGLLEGREEPRKFKSAFRKMKESLNSFFIKDVWVAASVDAPQIQVKAKALQKREWCAEPANSPFWSER